MVSEKVVETRKFAHKIVEAAAGSGELAQREPGERARRHRPQQEGHVREVAAFGEDADKVGHYFAVEAAVAGQRTAVITNARMRPSTAPLPNLRARASAAFAVASSIRPPPRASISFLRGVP